MSVNSASASGGHFRISDSDRNLVNDVLTTAYAEGRITRTELDERTTAVLTAKTFDDLAPITADLMPTGIGSANAHPVVQQYSSPTPATSHESGSHVVVDTSVQTDRTDSLVAIFGDAKRVDSGWRMRRKTSVVVGLGDAKLDLTKGVMEHPHCEIEVLVGLGDLKVIVPAGVRVITEASSILGDTKVKGVPAPPADAPTITISGLVLLGDVTVLGPDHEPISKRLAKRARRSLRA